jgi:hypothetical protein
MTWYVTDKREYLAAGKAVGAAFRELVGHYCIAMSAVQVAALIEDRAKVEIEATAVIPDCEGRRARALQPSSGGSPWRARARVQAASPRPKGASAPNSRQGEGRHS